MFTGTRMLDRLVESVASIYKDLQGIISIALSVT